jgi:hypothetical protein
MVCATAANRPGEIPHRKAGTHFFSLPANVQKQKTASTRSDGASTFREAQPIQTCSPIPSIIRGIEVEYVRAIGCIQDGGWGVHLERSGGKFRACEINCSKIGGYFPRRIHDIQPNHGKKDCC